MNSNLKIEIKEQANATIVSLEGQIDEDSDFSSLHKMKPASLTVDMNNIRLINSCGIREWIIMLEKLVSNGTKTISYINCPQVIIDQINMVKGFVPKQATIASFYAPYFCEACDKEQRVLLKTSDIRTFKAPAAKCPACGQEMEFDALEQQYFHFLKQQ